MLATYADDTVILASVDDPIRAANSLQNHLNEIDHWASKFGHCSTTFTLRRKNVPPLYFQGSPIPTSNKVKHLSIVLEKRG